jgi:hypothetical protein
MHPHLFTFCAPASWLFYWARSGISAAVSVVRAATRTAASGLFPYIMPLEKLYINVGFFCRTLRATSVVVSLCLFFLWLDIPTDAVKEASASSAGQIFSSAITGVTAAAAVARAALSNTFTAVDLLVAFGLGGDQVEKLRTVEEAFESTARQVAVAAPIGEDFTRVVDEAYLLDHAPAYADGLIEQCGIVAGDVTPFSKVSPSSNAPIRVPLSLFNPRAV